MSGTEAPLYDPETAPKNDTQDIVGALRIRLMDDPTSRFMQNSFLMLAEACFDTQFAEYEYFVLKKPFDPADYATRHAAVGRALERLKALADVAPKEQV